MYEWTSFDVVFHQKPDFDLDNRQIDAIVRERKEFGGVLFFDKIWTSIGLKSAQKAYPPKSNADLRAIWSKVASSAVADEKKQAILLYVLRDCSTGGGSKIFPNLDTSFADRVYLPQKYQILISGLWELDHAQFPRALEYLTDPLLTADFADDVLMTLIQSPKCDDALAMAYYITVKPPLARKETLKVYFALLVKVSVVRSYNFAQEQDVPKHKALFEEILRSIHEEDNPEVRAERAILLLSLPFSGQEQTWFEDYLLTGAGFDLPGAKDSVIMKRIAMGKSFDDVESGRRQQGRRLQSIDWNDIRTLIESQPSDMFLK